MHELAALRVKITRDEFTGHAKYPQFNVLQAVRDSGMDWSQYIDFQGLGWLYDSVSGHDDDDQDSPVGQQWGLLLVPELFAAQAVAAFGQHCERLSEADCSTFFDDRCSVSEPDELDDGPALESLERKLRLLKELQGTPSEPANYVAKLIKLHQQIAKALDPTDPVQGVKDNPRANWAKFKAAKGLSIKE